MTFIIEPILPEAISAVIIGDISLTKDASLTNETDTIAGSQDSAPNSTNVGRD